jgi:hypothetical protein
VMRAVAVMVMGSPGGRSLLFHKYGCRIYVCQYVRIDEPC